MSTDLIDDSRKLGFYFNCFYGGEPRGRCYQITDSAGTYVQLTESQMQELVSAFNEAAKDKAEGRFVRRFDGPASVPHKPGSDAALFELISEDELNRCPPDCAAPLERCNQSAVLRATTSSGYERRPLCVGHAHVVFSEWMVGI